MLTANIIPLFTLLQQVLKQIECCMRDPVWNDLEHAYYHQSSGRVLHVLHSFLAFPQGQSLTPAADKAVLVARRICSLSLPQSFLELVLELAKGKVRSKDHIRTLKPSEKH